MHDGKPVFRSDMPIGDVATLEEIANSTTASGSWNQMRGKGFAEATFSVFNERDRLGTFAQAVVLRRSVEEDGDVMDFLYVSDWEERGGYEFRQLAFGPVPTLSW